MLLVSTEWGTGDRLAVLLHGMLGSARQFHQVGPALADRGYRAIAVDLPGHGHSSAAPEADLALFAESVVETVGVEPELAIGHSLGAIVLAAALPVLRPARAVYVDVPFSPAGQAADADDLLSRFTAAKTSRTLEQLRISKPDWSEEDRRVEAEAAQQFDPATAVALETAYNRHPLPGPPSTRTPSLLVRAEPSQYVSAERATELARLGFQVRSIAGAGHSVWYGHIDAFLAAVAGMDSATNGSSA
jgi:pimeloyl-ACP methyl ester carboxylesterase